VSAQRAEMQTIVTRKKLIQPPPPEEMLDMAVAGGSGERALRCARTCCASNLKLPSNLAAFLFRFGGVRAPAFSASASAPLLRYIVARDMACRLTFPALL